MMFNNSMGADMDVMVWLRGLGLGKYEAAFRENEIDGTVLPNLTADDLKELGVDPFAIASSSGGSRTAISTLTCHYVAPSDRPPR